MKKAVDVICAKALVELKGAYDWLDIFHERIEEIQHAARQAECSESNGDAKVIKDACRTYTIGLANAGLVGPQADPQRCMCNPTWILLADKDGKFIARVNRLTNEVQAASNGKYRPLDEIAEVSC